MVTDSFSIRTTAGDNIPSNTGTSILGSALSNNIILEYSCKSGQCGACKTTLLEGKVKDIKPQLALSAEDIKGNKILTCCCEPISDILIDAEGLSALHEIEIKTMPVRIVSVEKLSADIIEVKFRLPPTIEFKFLEGQFIDVIGPGTVRRSYSIASISIESEISLLIKKVELGILSQYWFNYAKHNDLLRIEGPKGTFFLRDQSKNLVFLATGTGIAPIISMLNKLDHDDNFIQQQSISLFWGNRHPQNFVWKPKFQKIKIKVNYLLSKPNKEWKGEVGYVQDIAISQLSDLHHVDVYACGSSDMIQLAKKSFIKAGLEEKNFYSDAFIQS